MKLFLVLAMLGLLCACASAAQEPSPDIAVPTSAFEARVVRVIDGDTFLASRDGSRVRVRLIGIDAPESVQPEAPDECFGSQAAGRLRQLLAKGTSIRASFQGEEREDRFGRELWDVWLPSGVFVSAELVRGGHARARAYPPHTRYAETLAAEERVARTSGEGLHRACRT